MCCKLFDPIELYYRIGWSRCLLNCDINRVFNPRSSYVLSQPPSGPSFLIRAGRVRKLMRCSRSKFAWFGISSVQFPTLIGLAECLRSVQFIQLIQFSSWTLPALFLIIPPFSLPRNLGRKLRRKLRLVIRLLFPGSYQPNFAPCTCVKCTCP